MMSALVILPEMLWIPHPKSDMRAASEAPTRAKNHTHLRLLLSIHHGGDGNSEVGDGAPEIYEIIFSA